MWLLICSTATQIKIFVQVCVKHWFRVRALANPTNLQQKKLDSNALLREKSFFIFKTTILSRVLLFIISGDFEYSCESFKSNIIAEKCFSTTKRQNQSINHVCLNNRLLTIKCELSPFCPKHSFFKENQHGSISSEDLFKDSYNEKILIMLYQPGTLSSRDTKHGLGFN